MDLKAMTMAAQDAFVQKKITQQYVREFSPEKMLKVLAVLEAAREFHNEVLDEVSEDSMSVTQQVLYDAFRYLDGENNDPVKPEIIL